MRTSVPGDIVHGKLHVGPAHRHAMQDALLVWPDGPVTLTVERPSATRSERANAYYWGVVVKALADHTGYTPDEMHDVLKIKFIPKDVALRDANGTVLGMFVLGGSTAKLEGPDFYDYVERIRQWAFEALDVDIPPPDPEWREHVEAERRRLEAEHGQREVQAGNGGVPRVEAGRGARRARRLGDGSVVAKVERPESGAGEG